MLVSGSDDGMLRLWNPATGKPEGSFDADHRSGRTRASGPSSLGFGALDGQQVTSVAFGSNGLLVAAGYRGGLVALWDVIHQRVRHTMKGEGTGYTDLALHPDGSLLATVSGDRIVSIWDARSGKLLRSLESENKATIWSVAFSPDGSVLAFSDWKGKTYLWSSRPVFKQP